MRRDSHSVFASANHRGDRCESYHKLSTIVYDNFDEKMLGFENEPSTSGHLRRSITQSSQREEDFSGRVGLEKRLAEKLYLQDREGNGTADISDDF